MSDVRSRMDAIAAEIARIALLDDPSDADIAKMKRLTGVLRSLTAFHTSTTRKASRDAEQPADEPNGETMSDLRNSISEATETKGTV